MEASFVIPAEEPRVKKERAPAKAKVPAKKAVVTLQEVVQEITVALTVEPTPAPVVFADHDGIVVNVCSYEELLRANSLSAIFSIPNRDGRMASSFSTEEAMVRARAIFNTWWRRAANFLNFNNYCNEEIKAMRTSTVNTVEHRFRNHFAKELGHLVRRELDNRTLEDLVEKHIKGAIGESVAKRIFMLVPDSDIYNGAREYDFEVVSKMRSKPIHKIEIKYRDLEDLNEVWPRFYLADMPEEKEWAHNAKWSEHEDMRTEYDLIRLNKKRFDFDTLITMTVENGVVKVHGCISYEHFAKYSIIGRRRTSKKTKAGKYVPGKRDACIRHNMYNRDFSFLALQPGIKIEDHLATYVHAELPPDEDEEEIVAA